MAEGTCRTCGKQGRTVNGLCSAHYQQQRRKHAKNVATVQRQADQIAKTGKSLIEYAAQAKAKLMAALPQAADDLVLASRIAAQKGNSRPAETILREFPTTEDGTQRVLLSQFSAGQSLVDRAASGVKVFIGVSLGGMKAPKELPPETVDADEDSR